MGIRSRERRMRVLLVLALLCVVVAHGDPEVETLDNYRQGFASVPAAKVALTPGQEALNPEELLEIAQAAEPSAGVVELTKKIKGIQGDIKSVENKADEASADSSKAEEKAAASGPGAKKDAAMKDHIDSGAAAEDAKADLEDKKKQPVDLTIQQHDEAKTRLSRLMAPLLPLQVATLTLTTMGHQTVSPRAVPVGMVSLVLLTLAPCLRTGCPHSTRSTATWCEQSSKLSVSLKRLWMG